MANPYDTFGNAHLRDAATIPTRSPMYAAPMAERHWPLSKARRAIIIERLQPLMHYAETAPATDPGEGYWDGLESAYGCGEDAAIYQAAEVIRAVLTSLGLIAPAGFPLCAGCSRPADSGDHDPDCTVAEVE